MPNLRWLALCAALLSAACNSGPDPSKPSPLAFEMRKFEKTLPGCKDSKGADELCVRFAVEFPEVVKAPSPDTATKINAEILAALQPKDAPRGFEEESKNLFEDYANLRKEAPATAIRYEVQRVAKVLTSHAAALCIEVDENSYTGGAHPNSHRSYLNLRPQTGAAISLDEVLVPGKGGELTQAGENAFRETRGIPPDRTLLSAGFNFPRGRFELGGTWGIAPDGLLFYFNDYEIAPHSIGPTEVKIPWDVARKLVKGEAGLIPRK